MRILMVTPYYPPGIGGTPRLMQGIVDWLRARGHTLEVLTYGGPLYQDCSSFDQSAGYAIYRVPARHQSGRTTAAMAARLLALTIHKKYDLLISGVAYPSAILAYAVKRLFSIPYIVYSEGEDATSVKDTRHKRRALSRALGASHALLAISRFTASELTCFDIPEQRITLIPPGIYPAPYEQVCEEDTEAMRRRLGLQNKRIILTVARMTERKGHDTIIRTLPLLNPHIPDLHYLIVGKGNAEYLQELAKSEGVASQITILDYVPEGELEVIYNLCDVYAMVSRYDATTNEVEGFGIVYLEAGASGKPCIAGGEGGAGDAVIDGVTGIVVSPTSVEEVAGALLSLLTDRALATKLGEAGRKRVRDEFDNAKLLRKIENIVVTASPQ